MQTRFDLLSANIQRIGQVTAADLSKQIAAALIELREAIEAVLRDGHSESRALLERLGQQSRDQSTEGVSAMHARLDGMQVDMREIVNGSLARASEAQDARLADFGLQYRKSLADSARETVDEVSAKVMLLSARHDASQTSIARLGRVVVVQSLLIGVLIITTAIVVVMHFVGAR